jgi:hypothetical protein
MANYCECGCAEVVAPGNRYIRGHQFRRTAPARVNRNAAERETECETVIDQREAIDGIPFHSLTPGTIQTLRYKAQTDLFWLCTEIIGLPLVERVHKPLCDFLVQKDPNVPLADWDTVKKRMYLLSRNSFKSSIAVCDAIQVLLCAPNARILIMRGTLKLAYQMLGEIKNHFVGNPKLRLLFPEYSAKTVKALGDRDTLMCPARSIVRREPSVSIGTIESGKVGLHADWLLLDDLADDLNSRTQEGREKVLAAYQLLTPIAEAWAYTNVVGTPYHHSDLYAQIRQYADAHPDEWKVMVRGAWTLKNGASEGSENVEDYDLWYPERLSFELLMKTKHEMESAGLGHLFTNQYLCQATAETDKPRFSRAALESHTIPAVQCPLSKSTVLQFWDLSFSTTGIRADYTVGLTALIDDKGAVYIVDSVRDHFPPSALAARIVEFAAKWSPAKVGIENANGSQFLMPTITSIAERCRVPLQIEWVQPPRGKDAKAGRIYSAEGWLSADRLFFSASLPHLTEMYQELTEAGATRHDDLSDTLGYLLSWCGQPVQSRPRWVGFDAPIPTPTVDYEPNPVLGFALVG